MTTPTTQNLVAVTVQEWAFWGKATWNCITGKKSHGHHEDDDVAFAQHVRDNYLPPFYKAPITWPTLSMISDDQYYWSAVAMSYFILQAGFTRKKTTSGNYGAWVASSQPGEFPISESHSTYIRWAVRARQDAVAGAAFWGYRVDEAEAVPEVGDLVGYARGKNLTKAKALAFFDKTSSYASHTDLVVAKRPGEIDVIGGNVLDSVTKKTIAINAAGQITDQVHLWFVVMKRQPVP
jgi:hypothetical protein